MGNGASTPRIQQLQGELLHNAIMSKEEDEAILSDPVVVAKLSAQVRECLDHARRLKEELIQGVDPNSQQVKERLEAFRNVLRPPPPGKVSRPTSSTQLKSPGPSRKQSADKKENSSSANATLQQKQKQTAASVESKLPGLHATESQASALPSVSIREGLATDSSAVGIKRNLSESFDDPPQPIPIEGKETDPSSDNQIPLPSDSVANSGPLNLIDNNASDSKASVDDLLTTATSESKLPDTFSINPLLESSSADLAEQNFAHPKAISDISDRDGHSSSLMPSADAPPTAAETSDSVEMKPSAALAPVQPVVPDGNSSTAADDKTTDSAKPSAPATLSTGQPIQSDPLCTVPLVSQSSEQSPRILPSAIEEFKSSEPNGKLPVQPVVSDTSPESANADKTILEAEKNSLEKRAEQDLQALPSENNKQNVIAHLTASALLVPVHPTVLDPPTALLAAERKPSDAGETSCSTNQVSMQSQIQDSSFALLEPQDRTDSKPPDIPSQMNDNTESLASEKGTPLDAVGSNPVAALVQTPIAVESTDTPKSEATGPKDGSVDLNQILQKKDAVQPHSVANADEVRRNGTVSQVSISRVNTPRSSNGDWEERVFKKVVGLVDGNPESDQEGSKNTAKLKDVVVNIGVSLNFLRSFSEGVGSSSTEQSTKHVFDEIISPVTSNNKTTYVEWMQTSGQGYEKHVNAASVFVSHTWGSSFVGLVEAINHWVNENQIIEDEVFIWIDIFCANHHSKIGDLGCWTTEFKATLENIGMALVVLSPCERPLCFNSVWCLYEMFVLHCAGVQCRILMSPSDQTAISNALKHDASFLKLISDIDIAKAESIDKETEARIKRQVERSIGYDVINEIIVREFREWIVPIALEILSGMETSQRFSCDLHRAVSDILPGLGRHDEALAMQKERLESRMKAKGASEEDVISAKESMGLLSHELAHYDDALQLFHEVLELKIRQGGTTDLTRNIGVAITIRNMAAALAAAGRYDEALKKYEEVLEIEREALGHKNLEVADTLTNLGHVHEKLGHFYDALKAFEEAYDIYVPLFGPGHAGVADALNNLATIYEQLGRFKEALSRHQDAIEIRRKALGPDHPTVADTENSIGSLLIRLGGRDEEAISHLKLALDLYIANFGTTDLSVATALMNLGAAHRDFGQSAEALNNYQQAMAIQEDVLGADHEDVALSKEHIAYLYASNGDQKQARRCYKEAHAIYVARLGANHPSSQRVGSALAQ